MAQSETDRRYDRFTQSARDVLRRANDVSTHYGQNFIDTIDLFLGIINGLEDDPALLVLNSIGPDVINKARFSVESLMMQGHRTRAVVGLSERAKGTIELAREEADRFHSHPITSIHLLLGIIRTEEGVVAGVLESLGVNIDKTRAEVENLDENRRMEGIPGLWFDVDLDKPETFDAVGLTPDQKSRLMAIDEEMMGRLGVPSKSRIFLTEDTPEAREWMIRKSEMVVTYLRERNFDLRGIADKASSEAKIEEPPTI